MNVLKKAIFLLPLLIFIGCGSSSPTENNVASSSYERGFLNADECDKIIDKTFLTICYDNELKAAKSVAYELDGDLVNHLNIIERPRFYEEPEIDTVYRATSSDYKHSGYDRGHLAPDASFDWSQDSLDATYSLANIIPQAPEVNRHLWVKVEEYARRKAKELGTLKVLNVVKYSQTPPRIGRDNIAVSEGFFKVLYYEEYQECFYYENNLNASRTDSALLNHKVNCSVVLY